MHLQVEEFVEIKVRCNIQEKNVFIQENERRRRIEFRCLLFLKNVALY